MKYYAERALYYLFYGSGGENNNNVWSQFESSCSDKELLKFTSNYVQNTLNKMNETVGGGDSDQD